MGKNGKLKKSIGGIEFTDESSEADRESRFGARDVPNWISSLRESRLKELRCGEFAGMARKKKKISVNQTVEEATDLIMNYLSKFPEEEQEARIAALARRNFGLRRAAKKRRN